MFEGILWAAIGAFFKSLFGRLFSAKGSANADLKPIEQANAIEDKNRADLHDGDAAKRLSDEWSAD